MRRLPRILLVSLWATLHGVILRHTMDLTVPCVASCETCNVRRVVPL